MEKTEVPGIFKEKEGVLINKDNEALSLYKKKKMNDRKVEIIEQNVNELKSDMEEIKNLLKGLLNK